MQQIALSLTQRLLQVCPAPSFNYLLVTIFKMQFLNILSFNPKSMRFRTYTNSNCWRATRFEISVFLKRPS